MLEFQLFRLKVIFLAQRTLFAEELSPRSFLRRVIEERPTAEFRRGTRWHIGNVESIDRNGLYFAFGKTTTSTLETYQDGDFEELEFETSPYTHILLDLKLEVIAIAKKTKLSPSVAGISNRLADLLNNASPTGEQGVKVEISPLQDPEDFLSHIRGAHAILKFAILFSRPNPFDVNRDFVQPMQHCLAESNGDKGKVELKGENLNPTTLEELTRSAAATGDDASARLKVEENAKPVTKRLRGQAVIIRVEHLSEVEQKTSFLQELREVYRRIRG